MVIPDITRAHWSINIRKFVVRAHHLDELVELGSLTAHAAAFLAAAVAAGLNIVVAGGTQAARYPLLPEEWPAVRSASVHADETNEGSDIVSSVARIARPLSGMSGATQPAG